MHLESIKRLAFVAAVVALSGCATWATDSAPARDGMMYVTGQRSSSPTLWLCPGAVGKGECQRVEVTEVSK